MPSKAVVAGAVVARARADRDEVARARAIKADMNIIESDHGNFGLTFQPDCSTEQCIELSN